MSGYDIRPCGTDDASIAEVTALLTTVFPKAGFTEAFIRWQYAENPDGPVVGFNAYHKNDLVAHYATIPIVSEINGVCEKGLLSLNTATHPGHGGKGLFTGLAKATYTRAAEGGLGFVVGVANAASTPGFVRKLGFQLVGPLRAIVGFGDLLEDGDGECAFQRVWDAERLQWRLSNPNARYTVETVRNGLIRFHTASGYPMVRAVLGAFPQTMISTPKEKVRFGMSLHIGLDPSWQRMQPLHVNIPVRFRPSPLNLIFLDLTGKGRTLDADKVRFRAIDFDAY
jgi:GNAT superfamily N-acetyltransferase